MKKSVNLNISGHQHPVLPILTDPLNRRLGVLVPITEWGKLEAGIDRNSPLYIAMARLATKPFHECTLQEKSEFFQEKLLAIEMQHLAEGRYVIEQDDRCTAPNMFVHRYANHSELVETDPTTGETTVISPNLD